MMSWSCPFHSFQLPLHVPVIFSVCPLHFPCMSRSFVASHFPTSPVVPIGFLSFVSLSFPVRSPCFHFCPFQFLLCPSHFPLLSCHVNFLFPPLMSLHFLAFPFCCKSSVFAKRTSKNTEFFSDFRQKEGGNPSQPPVARALTFLHLWREGVERLWRPHSASILGLAVLPSSFELDAHW